MLPVEEAGPLRLRRVDAAIVVADALRRAPEEACGLLVGTGRTVLRVIPTTNAAASPIRYAIAPDEHLGVIRAARRDGLEVIGGYHSHPRSPAEPSPDDAAAAFAGFVFLIVGLAPTPQLRAWTFDAGNFTEVGLVRT
ncbi:MAG: Mov34/MPN/PAD-1 family protein [Vicinamibacterales bacterium]